MANKLRKPDRITWRNLPFPLIQAKVFLDEDDGTESWRYNGAGRLMSIKGYEAFFKVSTDEDHLRVNIHPKEDLHRVVKLKSDGSLNILFTEDGETNLDTIVLEKKDELIIEIGRLESGLVRYRVQC